MTNNADKVPAPSTASPRNMPAQEPTLERLQLLGEPALLAFESRDEYLAHQNDLFAELKPQGPLEAQFIEDVLYATWEIRRLRQARTELISIRMMEVAGEIVGNLLRTFPEFEDPEQPLRTNPAVSEMLKSAMLGDQQAIEQYQQLFEKSKLTWAEVHAKAIARALPQLERIDRLMDRAEKSRQSTLKDFQFLQATKAMALKRRSDMAIEDIPAEVIEERSE